jgi:lipopolysaccharide exporter
LYTTASVLAEMAVTEVASPLNRAMFSEYSGNANDIEALRKGFMRASGLLWLVSLPVAAGTGLLAPFAVRILFGEQWVDAALIVQVLCLANSIAVLAANASYVFLAMGKSRFVSLTGGISILVSLCFLYFLLPRFGLIGAAYAMVIASIVVMPLILGRAFRLLDLSLGQFLSNKWRSVLATVAMVAALHFLVPTSLPTHMTTTISTAVSVAAVGAAIYVLCVVGLWLLSGRPDGSERLLVDIAKRLLAARAAR